MSDLTRPTPLPGTRHRWSRTLGSRRHPLLVGAVFFGLLLLAYLGFMIWRMSYVPADLDFSTTRLSETGLYQATIVPAVEPVPVNQIHTWTLHAETAAGEPLTAATITIDGDMPQHGHGMPTRPVVTQNLGHGDYLVEGMKFQMGGWWVIDFTITDGQNSDRVSFNLMLQ